MMATARDVISMLEDAGAQKLFASNGHIKYKLPNGNLFISSGTPSDFRSFRNAISVLRRELKETHPHIAERGRNLPKNKRHTHHTLGDAVALKGLEFVKPVDALAAVPGAQLIEAEFEIRPPEPEVAPEVITHRSPRIQREPPPPPGKLRTLSPAQLQEANRILAAEGDAAMNAYLNRVRNELTDASLALTSERFPEPLSPHNRVPEYHTTTEEDEMSSILERARRELQATNQRIINNEEIILNTQIALDIDVIKRTSLETYIAEHETLASKAATLIADVLPPLPPSPPPPPPVAAVVNKRSSPKYSPLGYGMGVVEERAYPILRAQGLKEFGISQLIAAIVKCGLPAPHRTQISSWVFASLKRKFPPIVKGSSGKFAFKEPVNG